MNNFIFFIKTDREALLGFNCFDKLGFKSIKKLKGYFGSYLEIFNATLNNLLIAGLGEKISADFIAWRNTFDFQAIFNKLEQEKINFISLSDESYPELLKEISSPPLVLYYKGNIKLLHDDNNRLAIVGSREPDSYGERVINNLLPGVVSRGIQIVSGLALGIDSLAHQTTLENYGQTIAILGTGLDKDSFYPRSNWPIAEKIINQSGLLLSEFPPGTIGRPQNFPRRNRIISGLCQATLIIQAQEKSGSLITAARALEQNREVLAVPGNIFSSLSGGVNNLLKSGAKLVTSESDILEVYNLTDKNPITSQENIKNPILCFENNIEKTILELLNKAGTQGELISGEEIMQISQLDTAVINSTLSILELRGIVKSDGLNYRLN